MIGADLEDLQRLANEFQKAADRLRSDADQVGPLLMQTPWHGPDRENFAGAWMNELSPKLRSVADELARAAQTVTTNRDDQERTSDGSSDGGTRPGAGSGSGGSGGASGGAQSDPKHSLTPEQQQAQWKKEHAELADASYRGEKGKNLPPGWTEVKGDELKKLGLSQELLGMDGDGFNASVFRNAEGKYVLAFAGTDANDWGDWLRNGVGGALGLTTDYDIQAANAAIAFKRQLNAAGVPDSDMTLTGHSLGGRLATVASHATGLDAYTFNPAGTSYLSTLYASKAQRVAFDKTPQVGHVDNTIHAYDPLNAVQTFVPSLAHPIGERNYILQKSRTDGVSWGGAPLEYHSTEPLKQAFDDQIAGKKVTNLNFEPLWEDKGEYGLKRQAKQILTNGPNIPGV